MSDAQRVFIPHADKPRLLLIGDNDGIAPIVSFALRIRGNADGVRWQPLTLLGADGSFPFRPKPSTILVPGMPDGVIACAPSLDEHGIPSRLASTRDLPGCFPGHSTELAAEWLRTLSTTELNEVEIFVCGPEATLAAVAHVAREFNVSWTGGVPSSL